MIELIIFIFIIVFLDGFFNGHKKKSSGTRSNGYRSSGDDPFRRTETALRARDGSLLGVITTCGYETTLRSTSGSLLGTYNSTTNITRNHCGSMVGTGNLLTTLL